MKPLLLLFYSLFLVQCSNTKNYTQNLNPKIEFTLSHGEKLFLNIDDLHKVTPLIEYQVDSNPAYAGATKKYKGFHFISILKKIDKKLNFDKPFKIEVTTLDGWKAPLYSSQLLIKSNATLAIEELKKTLSTPVSKDGKWSIVVTDKKRLYPGPFYLVWNDTGKNSDIMPLQVSKIRILP